VAAARTAPECRSHARQVAHPRSPAAARLDTSAGTGSTAAGVPTHCPVEMSESRPLPNIFREVRLDGGNDVRRNVNITHTGIFSGVVTV